MTGSTEPGSMAPDFELPAGDSTVSLSACRGRQVVLFFYPKADTPGCTREAGDFDRLRPAFEACGTAVIGVSADPPEAQERFRNKHGLTIPLASDPGHATLKAYGVWAEKRLFARRYWGIVRSTFLIAADGRIARVWRNVRVPQHADAVLTAARSLAAGGPV